MLKSKTIFCKLKKPNLNEYVRKKTYDYKNIIIFDEDISEMDINIKAIPSFKPKTFVFVSPKKERAFKNTIKLKSDNLGKLNHCNSITTTTTSYRGKSVKKVSFSTVEIIRVEKYKKYNASSNFSKNLIKRKMEEMRQNDNNESNCSII